jgi:hypothetical protein
MPLPFDAMARSRRIGADLQLLAASALTGAAGASFVLLSERATGLDAFAPMAQLWTIWSISAASLMFGFQQWAIGLGIGRSVRFLTALRGGPLAVLVASTIGTGVVTFLARSSLFHTASLFWPLAAALVVLGTVLGGAVRGILAAAQRHTLLALVIAADNVLRVSAGVVLVMLDATVEWYAVALLVGYLALVVVRWSPRPDSTIYSTEYSTEYSTGYSAGPSAAGGPRNTTLGTAATAGFLSYIALAGPPLLIAFNHGSAETVSTLFVVLTAIRLPHLLLQAGAPRAGVVFQNWMDQGHHEQLARARLVILGATIVTALIGFGAGGLLGDLTIGTLFDIRGRVDALTYGLMAAAGVLSVGASFATVLLVAQGRNTFLVSRWLVVLALAVATGLVTGVTELGEVAVGLLVCHLVILLALTVSHPVGVLRTTAPLQGLNG